MAMKLGLFLGFFIPFSSFLSLAQPHKPPSGMNYWCRTTPHPDQCKIFMGSHHQFVPKHRTDFRTMVVQVAMERALHAQIHMKELRNHCHSKHEKAVWTDCSKLISNTIFQLNNTIQGLKTTKNCTGIDAQTWLSTALTNLETCRVGSVELNVSRFISPIVSNNMSELIRNRLAINGGLLGKQKSRAGFPSWVSDRERRLLQSPSLASHANYVVAKEGSGHFRSIQAAINYAVSKRRE